MDPGCSKELADKFNNLINQMLKIMDIEDDRSDMVTKLQKIEI